METVWNGSGDCADQSRLLCALLYSIGEKTYYADTEDHRFVMINCTVPEAQSMSRMTGGKGRFSYWTINDNMLVPMDTTYSGSYVGWTDKEEWKMIEEIRPSESDAYVIPEFPSDAVLPVLAVSLIILLFARMSSFLSSQSSSPSFISLSLFHLHSHGSAGSEHGHTTQWEHDSS